MSNFQTLPEDTELSEAEAQARTAIRLESLGRRLQADADQRVRERKPIEDRMLEDLRQYSGKYDPQTQAAIERKGGSQAFVNLTREKCDTLEARLSDALLPIDGQNWGIEPTPVPELSERLQDDRIIGQTPQGAPVLAKDMAKAIIEVAAERAEAMEKLMADQLAECHYTATMRELIRDLAVLGTGVLKGPFPRVKRDTGWMKQPGIDGATTYELLVKQDIVAAAERVDPFDFFPDLSAMDMGGCESVFQRHYLTRKQLVALSKEPGYLKQQIREILLGDSPDALPPSHQAEMREMGGLTGLAGSKRYQLWEYHGPVRHEDLQACQCSGLDEEADPLDEQQAVVWLCEGKVIKAALQPMEGGALPYHVATLNTDQTCLFGTGVPRAMQNSQRVVNAAWRAMMDNSGLSAQPQVIVDSTRVKPADGNWKLAPGKVWLVDNKVQSPTPAFQMMEVPNNLEQMQLLFQMAQQLAAEETGVYPLQGGDQSKFLNDTATGASIAYNSLMATVGRYVKNFDDRITKPFIEELYRWNMLHSDDEAVKGDYQIVAKGVAALLDNETQTQGLMQMAQLIANPVFAPYVKPDVLLEEMARVMRVPKGVFKTPDEIAQMQQQQPQQDPRIMVEQGKLQLAQAKLEQEAQAMQQEAKIRELEHQEFLIDQQGDMQRHTQNLQVRQANLDRQIQLDQLNGAEQLQMERERMSAENQRFNTEMAVKVRQGSGI